MSAWCTVASRTNVTWADGEGRGQVQRGVERVKRVESACRSSAVMTSPFFSCHWARALRDHARDRDAAALCSRADDAEARVTSATGRDDVGDARDELRPSTRGASSRAPRRLGRSG